MKKSHIHLYHCLLIMMSLSSMLVIPKFMPFIPGSNELIQVQAASTVPDVSQPHEATINLAMNSTQLIVTVMPAVGSVGELVTVQVEVVDPGQPLSAFQFDLLFNPAILGLEDAVSGTFIGSTGRVVICPPEAIPEPGRLRMACATSGEAAPPSGSGLLAEITMRVHAPGITDLDLENTILADDGVPPAEIIASTTGTNFLAGITAGLAISSPAGSSGPPGTSITYTLALTNTGTYTDSFALTAQGDLWQTESLSPEQVGPLGIGQAGNFILTVDIPTGASPNAQNTTTVTGASQLSPSTTHQIQIITTAIPDQFMIYLPLVLR